MYKCRYTFWDDKNFPGFKDALSDLYDRSIQEYNREKHDLKDKKRDIECLNKVFPLIEYYYVSLIKLGYVDKKNYFNILNQLKSIDSIGILNPGKLRGVTVGKKISVNPVSTAFNDLTGEEMFRLTIFHELGHIICESFNKDAANLCERLCNNSKIKNRLNEFGITNKNILLNGFVLLEDVLVNEVAEDVLYRSKESLRPGFCYYKNDSFPGVKYRSNYNLYTLFQELGLKFFSCFKFIDCFREATVTDALKKSSVKGFYSNFVNNIENEISSDSDKMSDFALMLGCLGKVKNACYSNFGLGVEEDKNINNYYYHLYLALAKTRMLGIDQKKNNI